MEKKNGPMQYLLRTGSSLFLLEHSGLKMKKLVSWVQVVALFPQGNFCRIFFTFIKHDISFYFLNKKNDEFRLFYMEKYALLFLILFQSSELF